MKPAKLPAGLKGIMAVPDARRAVAMGVRLIWVSNHGGRQLDHTQSSIEALPPIVEAVARPAEIVIGGGFSKGTHRSKGFAPGAPGLMLGPTGLLGFGARSAQGVALVLQIHRGLTHI